MATSLAAYAASANLPTLSAEDLGASLLAAADDVKTGGGGGLYLQFSGKTGQYKLSDTGEAPSKNDMFIVEPQHFIEGWTCWMNQKVKDRHKWAISERAEKSVSRNDLEDFSPYKPSEGWKEMAGFGFISTDGGAKMYTFENTSASGRNSISDLMKEIGKRASAGEPYMPVIKFAEDKFTVDDNTNSKPMFPVESWVTNEAVGAFLNDDVEYDVDDLVDGAKVPKSRKKN